MIWDSNALLWNSNALLCYGVCCKTYTWTDCIILVDARLIKLCSAVFFTKMISKIPNKSSLSCYIFWHTLDFVYSKNLLAVLNTTCQKTSKKFTPVYKGVWIRYVKSAKHISAEDAVSFCQQSLIQADRIPVICVKSMPSSIAIALKTDCVLVLFILSLDE